MSTAVTWPGRRLGIAGRVINAVAVTVCTIAAALNVAAGNLVLAAAMAFLAGANVFCFLVNVKVTSQRRAQVIEASRPRPDYALIARMEREVYGEAFRHDGAPGVTRAALDAEMDALVDACERHQSRREPGCFESLHQLRKERMARKITCESGYHVYANSEPSCMYCDHGWR